MGQLHLGGGTAGPAYDISPSRPPRTPPSALGAAPPPIRVGAESLTPLLVEVWAKHQATFWDATLRSPLLLGPLGQALQWSFGAQRLAQLASEAALAACGLPTREDALRLQHRLNQLEAALQRLTRERPAP